MPLRSYKPTSPGRRFMTRSTFEEITTTDAPQAAARARRSGAAAATTRAGITVRHRGGGEKRHYRRIDFKRDKHGVPARLATIEYDPNRSARIGLLHYARRREALHPGAQRPQGRRHRHRRARTPRLGSATPCRCRTCRSARPSTTSSSCPARAARSSARPAPRRSCWPRRATPPRSACPRARFAGSSMRCMATVGQVGNLDHENQNLGKAGRARHMGRRPEVRGVVDEPA